MDPRIRIRTRMSRIRNTGRPEVELPGGDALRHVSPAIQEGQPQLDDLEQVHVAAQQLVLVVRARLEVSDRPRTDYYS
jgi:hypothetical protein